jgi:predicted DsbA family dithiol-disulfide isomerase
MDHRQTSDDQVLADIAAQHGLTRDEALAALADPAAKAITHDLAVAAAQQGIRGVPFFIFDNRFAVSGSQPGEVFDRALAMALDPEAERAAGSRQ